MLWCFTSCTDRWSRKVRWAFFGALAFAAAAVAAEGRAGGGFVVDSAVCCASARGAAVVSTFLSTGHSASTSTTSWSCKPAAWRVLSISKRVPLYDSRTSAPTRPKRSTAVTSMARKPKLRGATIGRPVLLSPPRRVMCSFLALEFDQYALRCKRRDACRLVSSSTFFFLSTTRASWRFLKTVRRSSTSSCLWRFASSRLVCHGCFAASAGGSLFFPSPSVRRILSRCSSSHSLPRLCSRLSLTPSSASSSFSPALASKSFSFVCCDRCESKASACFGRPSSSAFRC
mmetsp:Transcript_44090/g.100123  ORF Transcript_44090/g.100123 Transcript_44090/m.100123 type:complete len:287 (-) Transcript_44090:618-1478(-)